MKQNRRSFLGYSLALGTSATAFGATEIVSFLAAPDAEGRVQHILNQHFAIGDSHRVLVAEFTKSLRTTQSHSESPEGFEGLLKAPTPYETVESYVIQEFIVSTNFLAFKEGSAKTLKLVVST